MSACISCWICATIESVLDDMAMLLRHNRWVVLPIIAQSRRPFNATTFICRFRMRRHGLWSHSNDYRYYAADQLPRLNRIIVLKELGFTLQQIGALLDDGLPLELLQGMLLRKQAEVEQQLATEQQRLA